MVQDVKTAVIGLGSMGYGMAASCLRAGHRTWGVDINPEAVRRFRDDGGEPGDLPDDLDALVVVVLNAAQTEAVPQVRTRWAHPVALVAGRPAHTTG